MFSDKEFRCISREIGMQQLEQRIDLVNCAGISHQEVGWVGRAAGGEAGRNCCNKKAKREAMRPDLGQVLQEGRGSESGETFFK